MTDSLKTDGKNGLAAFLTPAEWKLFFALLAAAIVTTALGQPYIRKIAGEPLTVGWMLTALAINGGASIPGILVGLLCVRSMGLGAPVIDDLLNGRRPAATLLRKITLVSIVSGILLSIAVLGVSNLFALAGVSMESGLKDSKIVMPTLFESVISSFYGGVFEEITVRFFLLMFYIWLFSFIVSKIRREKVRRHTGAVWFSILLTSVIFGLAHVLTLFQMGNPEPLLIVSIIVENALPGLVFGLLFWKYGLLAAMIAHFTGDVVLHVVVPALSGAW